MAGISRYEKAALGLTAAFLLFTGGWFLASQTKSEPYTVTVATQPGVEESSSNPEQVTDSSKAEKPESLLEGETININTAGLYDLQRLPGIGEKRAQAIIEYRESNGPFQTIEELDHVDGIGEGILSGLRDYVTVDEVASGD